MIELHTQVIKRDGKEEYDILPYPEYPVLREALADYDDLRCLREAKETEKDAPAIDLDEWKARGRKPPAPCPEPADVNHSAEGR